MYRLCVLKIYEMSRLRAPLTFSWAQSLSDSVNLRHVVSRVMWCELMQLRRLVRADVLCVTATLSHQNSRGELISRHTASTVVHRTLADNDKRNTLLPRKVTKWAVSCQMLACIYQPNLLSLCQWPKCKFGRRVYLLRSTLMTEGMTGYLEQLLSQFYNSLIASILLYSFYLCWRFSFVNLHTI